MDAPMKFVQIIEFETERIDEMRELARRDGATGGRPQRAAPRAALVLRDRGQVPTAISALIEFESYEDAMRNSDDPETTRIAERMAALCIRRAVLHGLRCSGDD